MKEGKITIKHYLNKRRGKITFNGDTYPVYVQVTVKRQNSYFKSRLNDEFGYWRDNVYEEEISKKGKFFKKLIAERDDILFILRKIKIFDNPFFKITGFNESIKKFHEPLVNLIGEYLKDNLISKLESSQFPYLSKIIDKSINFDILLDACEALAHDMNNPAFTEILVDIRKKATSIASEYFEIYKDNREQTLINILKSNKIEFTKQDSSTLVPIINNLINIELKDLIYNTSDYPINKREEMEEHAKSVLKSIM